MLLWGWPNIIFHPRYAPAALCCYKYSIPTFLNATSKIYSINITIVIWTERKQESVIIGARWYAGAQTCHVYLTICICYHIQNQHQQSLLWLWLNAKSTFGIPYSFRRTNYHFENLVYKYSTNINTFANLR